MAIHETKQSVFNVVWRAFVVDKAPPSMNQDGNMCQYRGADGAKCAVGLCIPDNMYDPDMDNDMDSSVQALQRNFDDVYQAVFNGIDVKFLSQLQNAHDTCALRSSIFHQNIAAQLAYVAGVHGLNVPTIYASS